LVPGHVGESVVLDALKLPAVGAGQLLVYNISSKLNKVTERERKKGEGNSRREQKEIQRKRNIGRQERETKRERNERRIETGGGT